MTGFYQLNSIYNVRLLYSSCYQYITIIVIVVVRFFASSVRVLCVVS